VGRTGGEGRKEGGRGLQSEGRLHRAAEIFAGQAVAAAESPPSAKGDEKNGGGTHRHAKWAERKTD
jgi:hypothetical protein